MCVCVCVQLKRLNKDHETRKNHRNMVFVGFSCGNFESIKMRFRGGCHLLNLCILHGKQNVLL